jgi:phosphohistidine phosphatase
VDRGPGRGAGALRHYLLRHGHAEPGAVDRDRPLSARGREEVRLLARRAAARGVAVSAIRHSGLRRARETAEVLAAVLRPTHGVAALSGLEPEADPRGSRAWLERRTAPALLVGHLPHLARLASLLAAGVEGADAARFEPATLLALVAVPGAWAVDWVLTPSLAGEEARGQGA